MNRSWQNNSNNSTGFVYFNTSSNSQNQDYRNKSDTAEFLAFSESPTASPQQNRFTPTHYSSPQGKFQRGSPRKHPFKKKFQRYSTGSNSSFDNSYSSFNSSFGHNRSWNRSDNQRDMDITRFLHPTFLEDPWARLEQEYEKESKEKQTADADSH